MDVQSLIITLLVGAVSGWLGGQIFQGGGLGLVGNIIVGILGSFVGSWLLRAIGFPLNLGSPLLSTILTSAIGAVVILFIVSLVRRN
jgi:uncharacterized membrane protein YeaQ/YmgE (transglycosylase-associated protein family)